ncbi:BTB/POZ domain-containing protein At5g48130 [Gastrolobium bilobum]|uniref:BTB/POZ domain-containing protein At5g48130 n=1 Tax=Gastrolobium bilobum TaxID=150636 RepID=UPI002AAFAAD3|nr:BTB/POZ domain-containing protein At5g48130 [Gastrolobium bilobum]
MEVVSPKDCSLASSPYSSPNIGALLKIKVITWSQHTGFPVSVHVRVKDKMFNLHKFPLTSKSGYFNKRLNDTSEIELPETFPGGPETFEMIALFIYGSSTLIDPFNVAALRCAAEFLEMTEDYCSGNLCERFDLYLNQVVLQSWDDTLIALQRCQMLIPWSEDLLIVSRCIESLAFMACMEILDPERRRDTPVVTLEELASQAWSCEIMKDVVSQDLWMKDLIALPFEFFKRVIGSLRRQGMKEKYVSPIIVFYANKWVLSKKTFHFRESSWEKIEEDDMNGKASVILQGVIDLLPRGDKARKVLPVGFYFALLSRSLEFGLRTNSKAKLQDQITSLLHFAQVEDFLLPESGTVSMSSSMELATMESIISAYVALNHTQEASNYRVAELWDAYLSNAAADPDMGPKRFMELIERVPSSYRQNHYPLYRAINNFLKTHPVISQDDKGEVCKYLDCQRLSQEACIEAVQNELMPLRLIVQALFVQQLNTHKAFKECSDSFRYAHCGDLSGSLSSSRCPYSASQNLGESPYTDGPELGSRPLSFLLQKDIGMQNFKFSTTEYESTSFRIQNLEQEIMSLKRSLQLENIVTKAEPKLIKTQKMEPCDIETKSLSKRRNPIGQATSCISSVNFASQRKYASRLLKIFRRIALFGSRKPKRKPGTPSILSKSM